MVAEIREGSLQAKDGWKPPGAGAGQGTDKTSPEPAKGLALQTLSSQTCGLLQDYEKAFLVL